MKPRKLPIGILNPKWNTGHPVRDEDLNQDRLCELEKARIANLNNYIVHLENRIVTLHKQIAEALRLYDKARKNREARS
jgi:hypothetical protein